MSIRAFTRRAGTDEQGGIMVTTAFVLPVLILFMVFVVDVSNWFEHKRHLQLQVDAAALAAAGDVHVPCNDTPIGNRVTEYGGGTYNPQVAGRQGSVHLLVNSPTYYNQSTPPDGDIPSSSPCEAKMIDVKGTETDLPYLFGLGSVSFINAQARVAIENATIFNRFIPVSLPEANYKKVQIRFINEATGDVLNDTGGNPAIRNLTANGTDGNGNTIWDNSSSTLPIAFSSSVTRIGVLVRLSTVASITCGDNGVLCYNAAQTQGLLFARAYTVPPDVTQLDLAGHTPKVRAVTLGTGSCTDGGNYFTAAAADCNVVAHVHSDWNNANPGSNSTGYNGDIRVYINGGNTPYTLSCAAGTTHDSDCSGTIPVTAAGNGQAITQIDYHATKGKINGQNCSNSTPCFGTIASGAAIQRVFAASAAGSGPIQMAQIWENGFAGANSFVHGGTHNLTVKISVPSSLAVAQSISDPIYRLRAENGNSQTQAIDCDISLSNFWEELAYGCESPSYTINTGESCAGYSNPGGLPDPSPCVVTQTGQGASQLGKGLNQRILGDTKAKTCTSPNHWSDFPDFDNGDPRIVFIIITPFGAFAQQGNQAFPVQDFAAFYITGWQGNGGFDNPCQKNGGGDDIAATGEVVGHWIKYISPLNTGGGSGTPCDFTSVTPCVATLTR